MNLRKLIFTNNACYKAGKKITPKGIMVHSTGANNPNLKRYVGPDDGLLGKNIYGNHWNQSMSRNVCVHAFIGKLNDGTIATYQTLPWDHRGWHCASGSKGSGNDTHIGFEICEDGLKDANYFAKVYKEAVELCAYLCKEFGLTENNIICHSEGYAKGIASNHGDVMHWFPIHGKSMDTFRADVKVMLEGKDNPVKPAPAEGYTLTQFVKDIQKATGAAVDGIAGSETISKTVTLSASKNRTHAAVKPVQKRLHALGYTQVGNADGVAGAKFTAAVKAFQAANGCVADGEITAKNKTWRKLLGMK